MSAAIVKNCVVCGMDVRSLKRTKDAAGNYYCHLCYQEAATATSIAKRPDPASDVSSEEQPTMLETALNGLWANLKGRLSKPSVSTQSVERSASSASSVFTEAQSAPPWPMVVDDASLHAEATPPFTPGQPSRVDDPESTQQALQNSSRSCANCGIAFGALQQGIDWIGHRVCGACFESLRREYEVRQQEMDETHATATEAEQPAVAESSLYQANDAARPSKFRRPLIMLLIWGLIAIAEVGLIFCFPSIERTFENSWVGPVLIVVAILMAAIIPIMILFQLVTIAVNLRDALIRPRAGRRGSAGISGAVVTPILLIVIAAAMVAGSYFGPALALGLNPLAASLNPDFAQFWSANDILIGKIAGYSFGLVISAFIWGIARSSACPSCRRYGVAVDVGSEHVGTTVQTFRTFEQARVHDRLGNLVGRIDVPKEIKQATDKWRVYRRCQSCNHEWSVLRTGLSQTV